MPISSRIVLDKPDDDDEDDAADRARDYVMARLGAAVAALDGAKQEVYEALTLFVTPADDARGKKRKAAIDNAIEAAGIASRALEAPVDKEVWKDIDPEMDEPWEEDDDDEGSAS